MKGQPARIRIKVNNLKEPGMINILYKAGEAGVQVELIVRSICCLVSDKDGMNGNIKVRRIVDRFLEYSRLFIFGRGEDQHVIMGSAVLMTRNLYLRIEVCFTVSYPSVKRELVDYFEMQWADNSKAVQQMQNNQNQRVEIINGKIVNAQKSIYQYLKKK